MTLEAAQRFKAEYAASSDTKKDEKFCGDMICMFDNDSDYFYSLISDGMGSGKEAALTSRLCGIFLKKMPIFPISACTHLHKSACKKSVFFLLFCQKRLVFSARLCYDV